MNKKSRKKLTGLIAHVNYWRLSYLDIIKYLFLRYSFIQHKRNPAKRYFYIAGIVTWIISIMFLIPFLILYIAALIAITFTSPFSTILSFFLYSCFGLFIYLCITTIASTIIGMFLWVILYGLYYLKKNS